MRPLVARGNWPRSPAVPSTACQAGGHSTWEALTQEAVTGGLERKVYAGKYKVKLGR